MKELVVLFILIAIVLPVCGDSREGHGQIIVSSASGTLEIGRPATISVVLKNNASVEQSTGIFGDKGTCIGVMAELHSHDDRIRVFSTPQAAGSLAPGENRSVEFMASTDQGMDAGVYPLELILNYSSISGVKTTGDMPDILFNYKSVNEVQPLDVNARLGPKLTLGDSGALAPGIEADITIPFINSGDEPISDLQVQLLPQDPFIAAEERVNLGSVDPGSSVSARFRISTANNTASGYYALPCNLSYKCGQQAYRDELAAIIEVKEGSFSSILALPAIVLLLVAAAYFGRRTQKGRKRLRKRIWH